MGIGGMWIDMGKFERPAMGYRGHRGRPGGHSASGMVIALAAMLAISGCSSVPDYANPVEWYNSTVDFFDDDVPPPLLAEEVPGANEPFPELSNMPEPPLREIELETLDSVSEGLVADRANAQYTDQVARASTEIALAEPPTFQAEPPTFQAEPFQTGLPPVPALQPSPVTPLPQYESLTQQTALQPAPVQTMPLQPRAVDRGVDVKTMFANLFASSGPRGVAPTAPTSGLPASASLTSPGGGLALGSAPLFGSSKAAVIYFAFGSARINKEGRAALHKLADYHKQSGGVLRVVGHASNRTKELSAEMHELVNFNISFKRARAVADELIRRGVPPAKLEVIARSDSVPVYQEWMPSGEAGNRRAEVYIEF